MKRLFLILCLTACGDDDVVPGTDAGPEEFDRSMLVRAAATCVQGEYAEFLTRAGALAAATEPYAADPTPERRDAARAAFAAAIESWQVAEVHRLGPAAVATEPGGRDLRDQIYAWPLVGRCKLDEQTVDQAYLEPDFADSLVTGRTLAALDYLLFYEGADNGCGSVSAINALGTWAAMDEATRTRRKAEYAHAIAVAVRERARELVTAWSPSGGNFEGDITTSGSGGATYMNMHAAANAISNALFYVEEEVKDLKLARPLGITMCGTATCPDTLESRWADLNRSHILRNLEGFRRLYQGCGPDHEGVGFDDWLIAIGMSDLNERMLVALVSTEVALTSIDRPFAEILAGDTASLVAVHTALKMLTDLLKTEFVSVLNLDLPAAVEGDND
jgi:predicted lipoprotein